MSPTEAASTERSTGVATIGVNLTWLVPGVVGGSEEYTVRLLQAVAPLLDGKTELRLYVRAELLAAYPDLADLHRTVVAPGVGSKAGRVGLEQTWLARATLGDRFVHHAGGTVPFVRSQPAVVTVHDLQPLEMPENFHPLKRAWLARVIPYAVRSARLVLCPSGFTADRLQHVLGVPADKIRVVNHGHRRPRASSSTTTSATASATGSTASPIMSTDAEHAGSAPDPRTRFGRYLLYPAVAYPHKRHIDVVRALARLGPDAKDVQVVFTGRAGPELPNVMAEARRTGLADRVHALGRIPVAELEALYRSAVALVFPSAYEGFGNPALEAMNLDCPVVASDAGALPEVVGEAGVVVPVGDVAGFAVAIESLLNDATLGDRFRRLGADRARGFDSGIAARQLAEVYCELVDSSQN